MVGASARDQNGAIAMTKTDAAITNLQKRLKRVQLRSLLAFHAIGEFVIAELPPREDKNRPRSPYDENRLKELAKKLQSKLPELRDVIPEARGAYFLQAAQRTASAFSRAQLQELINRESNGYRLGRTHVLYLSSPKIKDRTAWVERCFDERLSARELALQLQCGDLKRQDVAMTTGGRIVKSPEAGFRSTLAALASIEKYFVHNAKLEKPAIFDANRRAEIEKLYAACSERIKLLKPQLTAFKKRNNSAAQ